MRRDWIRRLGPGLIFAGTCVGVSHIVQSTRAGADYGFALLWAVILANVLKFPFFEYGPRYVAATGDHLLTGYHKLGRWAFILFIILTALTMIPIQAGVTIVTAGLFVNLMRWPFGADSMSALILCVCMAILLIGRYRLLERLMKIMILILSITTVISIILGIFQQGIPARPFQHQFKWDLTGVAFLVALMGWMPTALDISVWHSFWSAEHRKQRVPDMSFHEELSDFHIGYWGTMVLAVFFLTLGAFVMYGSGGSFSNSAVGFTDQVISLYTRSLGAWSYPVIVTAASVTMFSTTLSVLDAYPRVVRETLKLTSWGAKFDSRLVYRRWMMFLSAITVVVIMFWTQNMKALIDFATTLSFLAAPIFAFLNYRVITSDQVSQEYQPGQPLRIFSWIGIGGLVIFSLVYLYWRFFWSG